MIVDLFSGTRGWSEGLLQLGHHDIGLEWDADACATAGAAGHATIRADVEQYPCEPFVGKVDGLIASPPCTDWSTAGQQRRWDGESGRLVLEVERWVRALRPRWVACEQVPPALEVWVRFAHDFTALGYRCWAGVLNAADFGVPQTRRRAFLLCSLEREPHPPSPTHARSPDPVLFGEALLPWVSMADALGWRDDLDWKSGRQAHVHTSGPAPVVCGRRSPAWLPHAGAVVRTGANSMKHSRNRDEIVPYERSVDEPAPTLDTKVGRAWTVDRPATTIQGDPRVWPPGHKVNGADRERLGAIEADAKYGDRAGTEALRITIEDALVLQSFRADYPLVGNRTSQFKQVGNAVPPLLARHVLAALL